MEYSKESLLEQNKTFSKDDFIFFGPSSEDSETAYLSMMFPVRFVMRSCLFGSAEQGLMAEKAFMFSDQVALNKILDESNYKEKELSPFQITKLVTNNLSSINKLLNGEDPTPKKKVVATSKTWKTRPLSEHVTIHQNFLITEEQMSVLRFGHIPDAMEDHWFMYADDYSINYFRSWTGICIFQAFYHKTNHGYVINELRVNCNKEEYLEVDIHRSVALFYALLLDDFDGYSQPYWNAYMW